MPRFRVEAHAEYAYIDLVDAPTAADAGVMVGDKIRAGELEPIARPGITQIKIHHVIEPGNNETHS